MVPANHVFADTSTSFDKNVCHGRCVALMVALIEAPDIILTPEWTDKVSSTIIMYMTSDNVSGICLIC